MTSVSEVFPAAPGEIYLQDKGKPACLIRALTPDALADWRDGLSGPHAAWTDAVNFAAAPGEVLLLPDAAGGLDAVLLGLGKTPDPFALAALPDKLPEGAYRLDEAAPPEVAEMAALAWAMGAYRYEAYKSQPRSGVTRSWCCRKAPTAPALTASTAPSIRPATSSTRRPNIWGRRRCSR